MNKVKPNDPCWCGSGKKYKKCHLPKDRVASFKAKTVERPKNQVKPGLISSKLTVPEHIVRTDYAQTGRPSRTSGFSKPKGDELVRMREACLAARRVLDLTCAAARIGMKSDELDRIAHDAIIAEGAYPSCLNYHNYPKTICTSVNEVICHGIPDDRTLKDGDIVNVDVTLYKNGFHGDCSKMVLIGEVDEVSRNLVKVTEECLYKGIAQVRPGNMLSEVGRAIEKHAVPAGFSVVRAFVGHGIGTHFHMEPQVAHYFDASQKVRLEEGMIFTVEPMINIGDWQHRMWNDKWTAVTTDLQRSAQFEHTILVRADGPEILTVAEGESATELTPKGVICAGR